MENLLRVRELILSKNNDSIPECAEILEAMPETDRGAEWNFLMGIVCAKQDYHLAAQKHLETACSMVDDVEYREALSAVCKIIRRKEREDKDDTSKYTLITILLDALYLMFFGG